MGNIEKIERLTSQIKNLKVAGEKVGARMTTSVLCASGGGIAGLIDGTRLSRLPNTNVSTAGAVGAGLVMAAAGDLFDKYSEHVCSIGSGMVAYVTGCAAKTFAQQRFNMAA
jgi:hypothetical protein